MAIHANTDIGEVDGALQDIISDATAAIESINDGDKREIEEAVARIEAALFRIRVEMPK